MNNRIRIFTLLIYLLYHLRFVLKILLIYIWIADWLKYIKPTYLWCRILHGRGVPCKNWEMAPCGIGGGHNVYNLKCPQCNKKHWDLTQKRYQKLGGE